MSIQGPNQPEPKVPLSQLKNMADIDGDGKLRGSELLIFQSACEASGYDGISINLYNEDEDEPLGSFIIGQDTFSTNGKQDAKTYKNSRDEVDDAVGRNSRKTKKEVMAAYQTGASQIVGLVKQVPVDKRSEFIAYLDDLFQTNGPAKYSSAEDCSQVMNTLYKAVQAKIQKDYSTTTGAPSPIPVQSEPDTPLAEVPEVPTPTAGLPAEERPTFDPSSIDKATRAKANETIRSWGEKTNKIPREALGGEFGENNTADKVVDLVLAKMNITNMSDEQKASLRQSVIDANPSVFDKDGNVYANADIKKLDFPTAAAINHVFMGGDAPASKSSAAVEQKPDVDKTEANKPKTGDYSLADLNEIVKTRNPKNYVTQNGDKFTMYLYEKDDRRVTPFVGSKAAIVQTLKEMGTDMSVSAKDNGSTAVSGGQTPALASEQAQSPRIAKKSNVGRAINVPMPENAEKSDNTRVVSSPKTPRLGEPREEDLSQTVMVVQDYRTKSYIGTIKVGGRTLPFNTGTLDKKQAEQIIRQAVVQELGFATGDKLNIKLIGFTQ